MATLLHLPDLPHAGYATRRQRESTDAIMLFMRGCERDRLRLLTMVIEGKDKWRTVARDIWRGLAIDDSTLDDIYFYFVLQAAQTHPAQQRELLQHAQNPAKVRDLIRALMPGFEEQREMVRLMDKWKP
jgi:hypothetical protein